MITKISCVCYFSIKQLFHYNNCIRIPFCRIISCYPLYYDEYVYKSGTKLQIKVDKTTVIVMKILLLLM